MGVSEESKKKSDIKETDNKAFVSLAGLAAVGLALYFGLPYISNAIQSATYKTAPESVTDTAEEEPVKDVAVAAKKPVEAEKKAPVKEVAKTPNASSATPTSSLATMSQSAIEEAVDGSIIAALRPAFKSTYTVNSVDVSKIANLVSVDLSIDQVSYEVIYSFDKNFDRYQAKLEPEFKFFSRSPVFKIPK